MPIQVPKNLFKTTLWGVRLFGTPQGINVHFQCGEFNKEDGSKGYLLTGSIFSKDLLCAVLQVAKLPFEVSRDCPFDISFGWSIDDMDHPPTPEEVEEIDITAIEQAVSEVVNKWPPRTKEDLKDYINSQDGMLDRLPDEFTIALYSGPKSKQSAQKETPLGIEISAMERVLESVFSGSEFELSKDGDLGKGENFRLDYCIDWKDRESNPEHKHHVAYLALSAESTSERGVLWVASPFSTKRLGWEDVEELLITHRWVPDPDLRSFSKEIPSQTQKHSAKVDLETESLGELIMREVNPRISHLGYSISFHRRSVDNCYAMILDPFRASEDPYFNVIYINRDLISITPFARNSTDDPVLQEVMEEVENVLLQEGFRYTENRFGMNRKHEETKASKLLAKTAAHDPLWLGRYFQSRDYPSREEAQEAFNRWLNHYDQTPSSEFFGDRGTAEQNALTAEQFPYYQNERGWHIGIPPVKWSKKSDITPGLFGRGTYRVEATVSSTSVPNEYRIEGIVTATSLMDARLPNKYTRIPFSIQVHYEDPPKRSRETLVRMLDGKGQDMQDIILNYIHTLPGPVKAKLYRYYSNTPNSMADIDEDLLLALRPPRGTLDEPKEPHESQ